MPVADKVKFEKVRGAESRVEFLAAGSFTILLVGTLVYVHSLFAPIMPAARLWAWSSSMGVVIAIMGAAPLGVLFKRPSDREIVRIWAPVGKIVAVLYDTAIAASVWVLLPYASEPLRLLMVTFYAAAIAGQVIATAESLWTIAFGVVSVFGSAALFFFIAPGPYSTPLALFLLAFGAMMMGLAVVLKQAIRSAITARIDAEAASSELAVALDKVTAAQAAKARFIAAATHDLRQPLQAAALFFDQSIKGRDADARLEAVDGAMQAFRETNTLLDQILNHLRLDSGTIRPQMTRQTVAELIARVASEMEPAAGAAGLRIRTVASNVAVDADADFVARVLRNFLQNAIRHSQAKAVLVGVRIKAERVRIYIVDDGVGIAPADAPTLFEEYAQGASSRGHGMGLGLASARRLAELMGGRADLDPRWRRGAAFFVELARAQ